MICATGMIKTDTYDEGVINLVAYIIESARNDYIISKIEYENEHMKLLTLRSQNRTAAEFYDSIQKMEAKVREKEIAYKNEKTKATNMHNKMLGMRKGRSKMEAEVTRQRAVSEKKKEEWMEEEKALNELKESKHVATVAYVRYARQVKLVNDKKASMKENLRFFKTDLFDSALAFFNGMAYEEYLDELNREAMELRRAFKLHPEYLKQYKLRHCIGEKHNTGEEKHDIA